MKVKIFFKQFFKASLYITAFVFGALTFGQNLISDPGFEDSSTGALTASTTPWQSSSGVVSINSNASIARTGSQFVQLGNDFRNLRQSLSLEESQEYTLVFYFQFVQGQGPVDSTDGFSVQFREDTGGNGTEFTPAISQFVTPINNTGWNEVSITFTSPSDDVLLYIFKVARQSGGNNNAVRFDDFTLISTAIPCATPTGVSNVGVASQQASFSWDEEIAALNGFEWVVVEDGGDPNNPGEVVSSGTTGFAVYNASVSGLSKETDYDFYVRSDCDGDTSDWSTAEGFTTTDFQGNLISNPRFTVNGINGSFNHWEGFNQATRVDNILGIPVGYIDNNGTFRQNLPVVPGIEYTISYNYRWFDNDRPEEYDMTPTLRDPSGTSSISNLDEMQEGANIWFNDNFVYTHDQSSTLEEVRLQFFKPLERNQLHLYNITFMENITPDADYYYKNGEWTPSNPEGVTDAGDIYVFNGRVEISGNIDAANFVVSPYADVEVSGGLNLSGELTVEEENGVSGRLVFKSSNDGDGQLISDGVSGQVMVERFIPAGNTGKRAFRFVTSSVDSDRTIYEDWQENGRSLVGFGTHITGSIAGDDGFDESTTGAASMFGFDNNLADQSGGAAWNAISNTDVNQLQAGVPYRLFVRGDRTIDLAENDPIPAATNTLLRSTGSLKSGDVTMPLGSNSSNFVFVGNPYQAVVDMGHSSLTYTGVEDGFMYTWDPNIGVDGGFVIVSLTGGAPNPSSSGVDQYLQPGQSVFLRTDASAGAKSLTFTEASKATGEHNIEVFLENNLAFINMRLYETSDFSNNIIERDAVGLRFSENGNNSIDSNDAFKLSNSGENFAIINGNSPLGIESRALPQHMEEIQLFMNNLNEDNYTFRFHMENMPTDTKAFLKDNYLDTMTELEEGISTHSFDASTASATSPFRFSIVFEVISLSTENPKLADFKVYPNPVNDRLFLEVGNNQLQSVEVYNSLGQRVMQSSNELSQGLDVSSLSTGIYILNINTDSGSMQTKISKQ